MLLRKYQSIGKKTDETLEDAGKRLFRKNVRAINRMRIKDVMNAPAPTFISDFIDFLSDHEQALSAPKSMAEYSRQLVDYLRGIRSFKTSRFQELVENVDAIGTITLVTREAIRWFSLGMNDLLTVLLVRLKEAMIFHAQKAGDTLAAKHAEHSPRSTEILFYLFIVQHEQSVAEVGDKVRFWKDNGRELGQYVRYVL